MTSALVEDKYNATYRGGMSGTLSADVEVAARNDEKTNRIGVRCLIKNEITFCLNLLRKHKICPA